MNIGRRLPRRCPSVNFLNKNRNKKFSIKKKKRHLFQQDERNLKKFANFAACKRPLHTTYQKFYMKIQNSSIRNENVPVEGVKSSLQDEFKGSVQKLSCPMSKLGQVLSSFNILRKKVMRSGQEGLEQHEQRIDIDNVKEPPINGVGQHDKCFEDKKSHGLATTPINFTKANGLIFNEESQNNMCITNNKNTNFSSSDQSYRQEPTQNLNSSYVSYGPSYVAVNSLYAGQNISNTIQMQPINQNQATMQPYYGYPYVSWQNSQYYSHQVIYSVPRFHYMYYFVPTVAPPSTYWITNYSQPVSDFQTFEIQQQQQQQQQQSLNPPNINHNHVTNDVNLSMYSQFEYADEKQPFQVENTIGGIDQVGDLYKVSDVPLELYDLYQNPFFDHLAESKMSIANHYPTVNSINQKENVLKENYEPSGIQDLYKNPLFTKRIEDKQG